MCWYEADDDDSDDQLEKEIVINGDKSLKNILVFTHNSCVHQNGLFEKFIQDMDGGSFLYRVHRYIYVTQENCLQNDI